MRQRQRDVFLKYRSASQHDIINLNRSARLATLEPKAVLFPIEH